MSVMFLYSMKVGSISVASQCNRPTRSRVTIVFVPH
jgi:hypothetical protein